MSENDTESYKLGLALSGGGAKGFAHIGVLKAILEKGHSPDIIAGTSAGALAGALFADGYFPEEIIGLFENKVFKKFAEFTIPYSGLFKANGFRQFLETNLRAKTFEELKVPLKIVATDIVNGISVVFDSGPLIPAILASCAFPIIFTPVEINGAHYIDGGLFKNFPVSVIRNHCKLIVGVNVTPLTTEKYKNSLFYIAERTFHYVSLGNTIPDRKLCDILIEPAEVSKYAMFTLEHTKKIYELGYQAAIEEFDKPRLFIPD